MFGIACFLILRFFDVLVVVKLRSMSVYVFFSFLFLFPVFCRGVVAEQIMEVSFPDSLLTEDKVYEYTFSDFNKAESIVKEMRKQKALAEYRLDIAEGDLYFNTGRYYLALKYYNRVLVSDSVLCNDNRYMEQLHRMISCYDVLHNDAKKAFYVDMLLQKARNYGSVEMESVALFNMGKMVYQQGVKDKGYGLMEEAVRLMESTDYKYKYDNLRYNYNTLLVFREKDRLYGEALSTLERLGRVVTRNTGQEVYVAGMEAKELKAMYAHYAMVLFRLGRKAEAEEYYKLFRRLGRDDDRDNYLIIPYLFDRCMYDEVISMNSARESLLATQGDSVTYHMMTIKRSLGEAYKYKGDYKMAMLYFERLAVLRDSIKQREQRSAVLELATVYETNEIEVELQKRSAELRLRNVYLTFVGLIVVLLGVFLWRVVRYSQIMRRKNRAMVGRIEELLGYKDELYMRKEENRILRERIGVLYTRQMVVPESIVEEGEQDRLLFERLEGMMLSRKLYLQADFTRERFIRMAHIPKNRFAGLFKSYAGVSFTQYVNNLRLEYGAKLLRKYPNYTVGVVAEECGIPVLQTFHRLFLERFGVTPAEYRAGLNGVDNECDTKDDEEM